MPPVKNDKAIVLFSKETGRASLIVTNHDGPWIVPCDCSE